VNGSAKSRQGCEWKCKEESTNTAEQKLSQVRRIAREFSEKRKGAKQAAEKNKKEIEERNRRCRAEDENRHRAREAELMMLIQIEEEKAKQNRNKINKPEEELRGNWSKWSSQDPDGFDSMIPWRWLDRKLDNADEASSSHHNHSPSYEIIGENWGEMGASPPKRRHEEESATQYESYEILSEEEFVMETTPTADKTPEPTEEWPRGRRLGVQAAYLTRRYSKQREVAKLSSTSLKKRLSFHPNLEVRQVQFRDPFDPYMRDPSPNHAIDEWERFDRERRDKSPNIPRCHY